MTNEYRANELAAAEQARNAARLAYDTAKTKAAKRQAAESLEFWGNKVAFLEHVK